MVHSRGRKAADVVADASDDAADDCDWEAGAAGGEVVAAVAIADDCSLSRQTCPKVTFAVV